MSVLFVRPEGVVIAEDMRGLKEKGREDKAGKQIDVTILEEEGKTRMLLSDHGWLFFVLVPSDES